MEVSESTEASHQKQSKGHVHYDLTRIKAFRQELGFKGVFLDGAGRAGFTEQRNMKTDEKKDGSR